VNNGNRGAVLVCVQRSLDCAHLFPLVAWNSADAPRVTLRVTLTQGANVTLSSVDVDGVEILKRWSKRKPARGKSFPVQTLTGVRAMGKFGAGRRFLPPDSADRTVSET
jgi:hypothetical protein